MSTGLVDPSSCVATKPPPRLPTAEPGIRASCSQAFVRHRGVVSHAGLLASLREERLTATSRRSCRRKLTTAARAQKVDRPPPRPWLTENWERGRELLVRHTRGRYTACREQGTEDLNVTWMHVSIVFLFLLLLSSSCAECLSQLSCTRSSGAHHGTARDRSNTSRSHEFHVAGE